MVTFYPRNIELWRDDFSFTDDITLIQKEKPSYKTFHNRKELIEFLKIYGIRLDGPGLPLEFIGPEEHHLFGHNVYEIVQWTVLGWVKEDFGDKR